MKGFTKTHAYLAVFLLVVALLSWTLVTTDAPVALPTEQTEQIEQPTQTTPHDFMIMEAAKVGDSKADTYMTPEPMWV